VPETGTGTGTIYAPRIGIVEGALFNGRVEMVATAGAQARSAGARQENPPGIPLTAEETERMLINR
jgi:hypothetical protein